MTGRLNIALVRVYDEQCHGLLGLRGHLSECVPCKRANFYCNATLHSTAFVLRMGSQRTALV
jgi:hypothetical protein